MGGTPLVLRDAGFDVTAMYVRYPPLLPRLAEEYSRGVYEGFRYLEGYTVEQKALILSRSCDPYRYNPG